MAIIPKPDGNVLDYNSGSTTATVIPSGSYEWKSLSIINDGASALTITLNGMTITVQPDENFTDNFVDFNSITVTTSGNYRMVLRG